MNIVAVYSSNVRNFKCNLETKLFLSATCDIGYSEAILRNMGYLKYESNLLKNRVEGR